MLFPRSEKEPKSEEFVTEKYLEERLAGFAQEAESHGRRIAALEGGFTKIKAALASALGVEINR
jgi:hypothetical protein